MDPARPPVIDRYLPRLFPFLLVAGLLGIIGLSADSVLLLSNYRLSQAAVDNAALAAAGATITRLVDGVAVTDLRTADTADQASAYTLAQETLAQAGLTWVTITDVVSDGDQVLVHAQAAAPTLFVRVFGVSAIHYDLAASAKLQAAPVSPSP